MGPAHGAGLDDREAPAGVRPDGRGQHARLRGQPVDRGPVGDVGGPQLPRRGRLAEPVAQGGEPFRRPAGQPDPRPGRGRAREVGGGQPADEAGRARAARGPGRARRPAQPRLARQSAALRTVANVHHAAYGASAAPARGSARQVRRTRSTLLPARTAAVGTAQPSRWALNATQHQPALRTRFVAKAVTYARRSSGGSAVDGHGRRDRQVRVERRPDDRERDGRGLDRGLAQRAVPGAADLPARERAQGGAGGDGGARRGECPTHHAMRARAAGGSVSAVVRSGRRLQQRVDEDLGVERRQVVDALADPDELDRARRARAAPARRCRPWRCRRAWSARCR